MTDYFALLDQPRTPWLNLDELKQTFHAKTLIAHPDAHVSSSAPGDAEEVFTVLNDAYQTLQDPKRRLQHLLALAGHASTSRFDSVPEDIAALFPAVAAVTQGIERFQEKTDGASTALSRSLLTPERLQLRDQIDELLLKMSHLKSEADGRLQKIDASEITALHALSVRYSYLQRWIAQLEEHAARLFI